MKKQLYVLAFLITVFLLATILILGDVFDSEREETINSLIQDTYNNLHEMQTFMLMSEIYGDDMACLAFKSKLDDLDDTLWELGVKLDRYRTATEEFAKDPFYLAQKKVFNENEVFYLMLLAKVNQVCDYDQEIISFYYVNSEDCTKCDDQSFILTDIKRDAKGELLIFSFDADLDLTSIQLLMDYHELNEFPCLVINDETYCGIQSRDFIIETVCENSSTHFCTL